MSILDNILAVKILGVETRMLRSMKTKIYVLVLVFHSNYFLELMCIVQQKLRFVWNKK